jgi:hypothetical protein
MTRGGFAPWPHLLSARHILLCRDVCDRRVEGDRSLGGGG